MSSFASFLLAQELYDEGLRGQDATMHQIAAWGIENGVQRAEDLARMDINATFLQASDRDKDGIKVRSCIRIRYHNKCVNCILYDRR